MDTFILDTDLAFEQDLIRHPFHLKSWLRYLDTKQDPQQQLFILKRSLLNLPASYKLWKRYLDLKLSLVFTLPSNNSTTDKTHAELQQQQQKWKIAFYALEFLKATPLKSLEHSDYLDLIHDFEQCLSYCYRFPVLWLSFLAFLMHFPLTTYTRRTFDRALQSLPITQHPLVWKLYLAFAERAGGETCVRIWRRYLKLEPFAAEAYAQVLISLDPPRYAEAAYVLSKAIASHGFQSSAGKSHYALWSELSEWLTEHSDEIDENDPFSLKCDVNAILRAGISKFTDQVGKIWISLARWWMLKGEWDQARDVFEEAMVSVMTVRDFSLVFDTFAKMEEDILSAQMEQFKQAEQENNMDDLDFDEMDLDMGLARFEKLMDRRPFLVNDVLLRQNPHNVTEWQNRIALWKERENHAKVFETFEIASRMMNGKKATLGYAQFWIDYAQAHVQDKNIDLARKIYERAVKASFKKVEDLVDIWCSFAEMEIAQDEPAKALDVLSRACLPPRKPPAYLQSIRYSDEAIEPQKRLFKSIKLWSFLADLQESIGTLESTRIAYDKILELKIATPQVVINYASFLEEKSYFEESFRVYERGIELFGYPISFEIWNIYLDKFIKRYEGSKIDRTRDLFEHALEKIPEKFAKALYAQYEEEYGMARHAMAIYDRATDAVADIDRAKVFEIYVAKATQYFGLAATRDIYSKAIEVLPDKEARSMCLAFALVEIRLGEIDRARVLYAHCSQMCDPRLDSEFWKLWSDFEVKYGNEDTFKEMLRIKRSVQAKFNQDVSFITAHMLSQKESGSAAVAEEEEQAPRTMADLEAIAMANQQNTRVSGFVRATVTEPVTKSTPVEQQNAVIEKQMMNPDEIVMDDEDEMEVERVQVPSAVFGSLTTDEERTNKRIKTNEASQVE